MGGTSSSTTVADSVENDSKEMNSQNYGLINLSNESLGSTINVLEIVTFLLIMVAAIFFLTATFNDQELVLKEIYTNLRPSSDICTLIV